VDEGDDRKSHAEHPAGSAPGEPSPELRGRPGEMPFDERVRHHPGDELVGPPEDPFGFVARAADDETPPDRRHNKERQQPAPAVPHADYREDRKQKVEVGLRREAPCDRAHAFGEHGVQELVQ
jgi:hypothetical protein